ncbi:MAG: hypothetical protein ACREQZ_03625 [Woeseiaceae bacterium]
MNCQVADTGLASGSVCVPRKPLREPAESGHRGADGSTPIVKGSPPLLGIHQIDSVGSYAPGSGTIGSNPFSTRRGLTSSMHDAQTGSLVPLIVSYGTSSWLKLKMREQPKHGAATKM